MSRDDEQVWADLVETFHSADIPAPEDGGHRWPEIEDVDPDADTGDGAAADASQDHATRHLAGHELGPDDLDGDRVAHDADDHYVPPPPPPIPRGDLTTRLAWAAVLGTPAMLTVLAVLGRSVSGPIALLAGAAFIGGFVTLISRLRGHDPHDPDDGAVV